jgi:hypothetical protein
VHAYEQFGRRKRSASAHADESNTASNPFFPIEAGVEAGARLLGEHTLRG